ncbi:unnamed protein product [Symbiodinium sp. CCMP2592]|nr:unnamed protein product [Symbiodinium sp. CCMP2592]
MLQNTRGRTVFAFQPKRLPKDVDRLTFFKGSIVRKKSLGPTGAEEGDAQKGDSERFEPPPRSAEAALSRSASVNDLRFRVQRQRSSEPASERSESSRLQCAPSRPLSARLAEAQAPPPLPAFPGSWKSEDSAVHARKVPAASGAKPPDSAKEGASAEESGSPAGKSSMTRSPSMPLPKRPTVPCEKRRPRPRTAGGEEAAVAESDGSPTSSQITSSPKPSEAPSPGLDPATTATGYRSIASSRSTPQLVSNSRPPPPLPPPIPQLRLRSEGQPHATLLAAASAQATLLSPMTSARRPSQSG